MGCDFERAKKYSIVLQGPLGVGKSTIAGELAKRTNLPHVWADSLRSCPKNCEEMEEKIERYTKEIARLEKMDDSPFVKSELNSYKSVLWLQQNYLSQRKLFPNLPNYFDFGFIPETSACLRDCYGPFAWHMYHKQFENMLLEELTKQVNFPCILDLGGGMASSPKEAYDKTLIKILESNNRYFSEETVNDVFNFEKMDFNVIKNSLKPFKNVVTFKQKIKNSNGRGEGAELLNEAFIASGDFDQTATISVDATGLISDNGLNDEKVNEIVSKILSARNGNPSTEDDFSM